VIDYFLYTDTRLHLIATPTLVPLLSTSSGSDDLRPMYFMDIERAFTKQSRVLYQVN
jgi:hypothetical protein